MNELKKRRIEEKIRSMPEEVRDKGVKIGKSKVKLLWKTIVLVYIIGLLLFWFSTKIQYNYSFLVFLAVEFGIVGYFIHNTNKIDNEWRNILAKSCLEYISPDYVLKYGVN